MINALFGGGSDVMNDDDKDGIVRNLLSVHSM